MVFLSFNHSCESRLSWLVHLVRPVYSIGSLLWKIDKMGLAAFLGDLEQGALRGMNYENSNFFNRVHRLTLILQYQLKCIEYYPLFQ